MSDLHPVDRISSLLFQCALQIRELYQKKNNINQQIRGFRASIAERKAYIDTLRKDIKKLDEDILKKQNTLTAKKALNKRLKITNDLLLQYVQIRKQHLEETKANYQDDLLCDEERIAEYQKKLEDYKDCYYKNPQAQKLLALQVEKEEIESQIKACDDQITKAQKELDMLTGPAATSSPEKPSASVSRMQPATEPEEQLAPLTEEDSDSLHLHLSTDGEETAVDENVEENCEGNKVQDLTTDNPVQEEEELGNDQRWTDLMESEAENQDTKLEDQEPQSAQSDMEEAAEEERMEEDIPEETEQVSPEGYTEGPTASPPKPFQETHSPTSPATVKAATSPTFPFNFGSASSPSPGTSDTKFPAFMFPSTPGFPGFGFDAGSSQDEDPSFSFTSPFFNEKETTASKSSSCSEFLFGQPEQSQGFQFAFAAESPQTTKKESSGDDFPFSFNF